MQHPVCVKGTKQDCQLQGYLWTTLSTKVDIIITLTADELRIKHKSIIVVNNQIQGKEHIITSGILISKPAAMISLNI